MGGVEASYDHKIIKTDNGTKIDYKPSPVPKSLSVVATIPFLIPIGIFSALLGVGWLGFFLIAAGMAVGIHQIAKSWRGAGGSIVINERAVIVNGKEYARADIRKILVSNLFSKEAHRSTPNGTSFVLMGGTGVTGAAIVAGVGLANATQNIGRSSGEAAADILSNVSYRLEFIYGSNKTVKLARFLSKHSAELLFDDVLSILAQNSRAQA